MFDQKFLLLLHTRLFSFTQIQLSMREFKKKKKQKSTIPDFSLQLFFGSSFFLLFFVHVLYIGKKKKRKNEWIEGARVCGEKKQKLNFSSFSRLSLQNDDLKQFSFLIFLNFVTYSLTTIVEPMIME